MRRLFLSVAIVALGVGALGLAGCSKRSLKAAGAECNATSECEEGLTCDFGQDPPVCSTNQSGDGDGDGDIDGSPVDSMDPPPPDAAIDAS
jgi:hypothetical protein